MRKRSVVTSIAVATVVGVCIYLCMNMETFIQFAPLVVAIGFALLLHLGKVARGNVI